MLGIVSRAIPPDNREATYQRFVTEARVALEHAVAATCQRTHRSPSGSVRSCSPRMRRVGSRWRRRCRRRPRLTRISAGGWRAIPAASRRHGRLSQSVWPARGRSRDVSRSAGAERAHRGPARARGGPDRRGDACPGVSRGAGVRAGPGRHAEEQMHADCRQPPSRSTLERVGKAIGTQTHRVAPRIEAVVRQEEVLPPHAHAIVVGLDRPRSRWKSRGPRARPRRPAANGAPRRMCARGPHR